MGVDGAKTDTWTTVVEKGCPVGRGLASPSSRPRPKPTQRQRKKHKPHDTQHTNTLLRYQDKTQKPNGAETRGGQLKSEEVDFDEVIEEHHDVIVESGSLAENSDPDETDDVVLRVKDFPSLKDASGKDADEDSSSVDQTEFGEIAENLDEVVSKTEVDPGDNNHAVRNLDLGDLSLMNAGELPFDFGYVVSVVGAGNPQRLINVDLSRISMSSDDLAKIRPLFIDTNVSKWRRGLDLSDNKLSGEFPDWVANLLSTLWKLSLRNNRLTSLPSSFKNLTHLDTLDLSKNELKQVPSCIYEMKSLKNLFLGYNGLTTVSPSIGNLSNLRTLALDNNRLTEIPNSLIHLELRVLNLSQNCLQRLPPGTSDISHLQALFMEGNPVYTNLRLRKDKLKPRELARLCQIDIDREFRGESLPINSHDKKKEWGLPLWF